MLTLAATQSLASSFVAELLVISAVALACKAMRLPYTIALVAVGLGLGLTRPWIDLEVQLTPDLLFTVLLPGLLFEAAIHLPLQSVLANLRTILLLAVPGLLITTLVVGYGLHAILGISLKGALIFGALISATDPVSVLALFKRLRAPRSLAVVVEGESLLNDGAAVVLFSILVAGESQSWAGGVGLFLFESVGGLLVGGAAGWMVWRLVEQIDDHLVENTLSMILAYGSYLIAETFHASGVMAVIAAGLVFGNFAIERTSVTTRLALHNTWDLLGFLCNSLVFLLIGTQVNLHLLLTRLGPIAIAFAVVCLARGLALILLWPFSRVEWRWQLLIFWSGLRGSIAMALAMGLSHPDREAILLLTFGVVLLSVFGQGLTVKPLMKSLGLTAGSSPLLDYEMRLGELMASQRALAMLTQRSARYHISAQVFSELSQPLKAAVDRLRGELEEIQDSQVLRAQRQEAMALMHGAQRVALREAWAEGLISEEAYNDLLQRLHCDEDDAVVPLEPT